MPKNNLQSASSLVPVAFGPPGSEVPMRLDPLADTLYATQRQIAAVFEVDHRTVSHHLANIFNSGELDRHSVVQDFRTTAADGKTYTVAHLDLDAIIAVGYRVNSAKATAFRQWATRLLRCYLKNGVIFNESVLRTQPKAVEDLHAKLTQMRIEERDDHKYILELIRAVATDFDEHNPQHRNYAAEFQDRMHYAATGMTAAGIKMSRCDATKLNMGLTVMTGQGGRPKRTHAQVAKNYLDEQEFRILAVVAESFGAWVQRRVLAGARCTTAEMFARLDAQVAAQELAVFPGYKHRLDAARADRHVDQQVKRYEVEGNRFDQEFWNSLSAKA